MVGHNFSFHVLQLLALAVPLFYLGVRRKQRLDRVSTSKAMFTRLLFLIAGFAVVLWPMISDAVFVDHFPDEASLPGAFFGSVLLASITNVVIILYALYRIVTVGVRAIKGT